MNKGVEFMVISILFLVLMFGLVSLPLGLGANSIVFIVVIIAFLFFAYSLTSLYGLLNI